ncbi:MAG: T9SS type A sorting domain-containing protein [Flavipsychrobacter sp.]
MVRWYVTFLILCSSVAVSAQDIVLRNFDVFSDGTHVQVKWTIEKGSICNGTKIYRSENGIDYKEIGFIDGICGSSTEPVGYEFTDTNPIANKKSYYKLRLGLIQFTSAREMFFLDASAAYTLFPNPSKYTANILYNSNGQKHDFQLFDLSGRRVVNLDGVSGNEIKLHRGALPAGLYLLVLQSAQGQTTTGKLLFVD